MNADKAKEIAEEAYENFKGEDDPEFCVLPKDYRYRLIETVEAGGDDTPFGLEVKKLLAPEEDETEKVDVDLLGEEEIATEAQVTSGPEGKSLNTLQGIAKSIGLEYSEEADADDLFDLIVTNVATKEVVEAHEAAHGSNEPVNKSEDQSAETFSGTDGLPMETAESVDVKIGANDPTEQPTESETPSESGDSSTSPGTITV